MAKVGAPSHAPTDYTRGQVDGFVSRGAQQAYICHVLKISPKTLRKHYRSEIEFGLMRANDEVARCAFEAATTGPTTPAKVMMIKWWEATRAGISEKIIPDGPTQAVTDKPLTAIEWAGRFAEPIPVKPVETPQAIIEDAVFVEVTIAHDEAAKTP